MRKLILILKALARYVAKKVPMLRKVMRKVVYAYRRIAYMVHGTGTKIDEKKVIFESFNGKSYSCTPKAVYEYMLAAPEYGDYKFVWIFKEPERYESLKDNDRTELVRYRTRECERALSEAKYWIFNYRALDYWIPKKNQVYVQCWHGTPLKKLGYDIEKSDNAMNSLEEIRDKYRTDAKRFRYLLSPCRFASEVFTSAWNLKSVGKEDSILEVGYPRNDFLVNHTDEDVKRIKEKFGFDKISKKIILYAPTWRDNQHSVSRGYTYKLGLDFDRLREALADDYVILFRAHYLVANSFDFKSYEGFVYDVSDIDDINELYVISDMLITDYSSVFFDYAILERPIIFYMYDLEEYRDELRGFYLELEELPGKVIIKQNDLIDTLRVVKKRGSDSCVDINLFNEKYNYLNKGRASERFVKRIITVLQ